MIFRKFATLILAISISGLSLNASLVEKDREWMGGLHFDSSGWVKHETLGWLWSVRSNDQAIWLYAANFGVWFWTFPDIYPYLWAPDYNWIYYEPGTEDPLWLYSFQKGMWVEGEAFIRYPLSLKLPTGPSDQGLYATVSPFEHADAERTHVHRADFGGSLDKPGGNEVLTRHFEGTVPTPYNIVTREEEEMFVLGGLAGEDLSSNGPFVAKYDTFSGDQVWSVLLRDMRELGEFMWPGLITAHGNGFIYVVAGSNLWKLDGGNGSVEAYTQLPAPAGSETEDVAYNGFTVLEDGTIVAKSIGRPAGCEAQGTEVFTECAGDGNLPPAQVVALDPDDLSILDRVQLAEASGGRITSTVFDGAQWVYVPGIENILRFKWTGSQLVLDTEWGVESYVKPGQTPASAPVVMGNWVVFQTNYSLATAPLTVWAVSQANSSLRLSIDPFELGLNDRSAIPSALTVDPDNMRIFAMDGLAQKIAAIDLTEDNALELRWTADQMTFSHTSLAGPKEERVLVASSIVDFQPGPGGATNYDERVVWRSADTGEELAQSDLLGKMAQGVPIAPGFFGVWYYLGLDGSIRELMPYFEDRERIGFEIQQFVSADEIITWTSREITLEEYEALELPAGWSTTPPKEFDPDEGGHTRSPGAAIDGDYTYGDFFGFEWLHNATVVEFGISMDSEGLLGGAYVSKHQEVTYYGGRTVYILISPDGDFYIRLIRDAFRTAEEPSLPADWQKVEYVLPENLTIRLPNPTLAIFADNGDSFQGPLTAETLGLPVEVYDNDQDNLTDTWELKYFGSVEVVDGMTDTDGDGLTEEEELAAGTSPLLADTDGDGVDDATEIQNGTDPLVPDVASIMITGDGVPFVRTDESRFENLPDWPYDYKYVEIDGLRQAYAEAGPADGPVVLLLHGQPSWSYLYREMMPVLADAGYRVIAMDHLGCGRSDKPIDIDAYSYLGHCDRLEQFIQILGLSDINLFGQDWGSLIGLRVAGMNPEWFASIAIGNGDLIREPAGVQLFPPVENRDEILDIESIYGFIPDQQVPFFDGCDLLYPFERGYDTFHPWAEFAMKSSNFIASEMLEALTYFPLTEEEEAAYDAPFPTRTHMAGIRVFPSLINEIPGTTDQAWEGLGSFEKPFLAIWGGNDPSTLGSCEMAEALIADIPGSTGQPHDRLPQASHFLQEDEGGLIAARLVEFYAANGIDGVPVTKDLGFELFEVMSPNEIVVWFSDQITEEEFNAIELPAGWFRSQIREGTTTSDRFLRSPNATEEGPLFEAELFGHTWQQNAILIESGIPMDDQGLLEAAKVAKYHELTYVAGKTVQILISPEDEYYILVGRDANRTQEIPTIPDSWQLIEKVLTEDLVIQLPNPTLNIRADNEDSFQGPLSAEEVALGQDIDDPEIFMTEGGVAFVRTPAARFENLPDWPYDYKYVEIEGLRQAYAEAGPADGPVVLLLHGQPSWSYLYRKMIPILADAGYRVIAMDHLGCGRSDKPIDIDDYTYLGHNDRLEKFILGLGLTEINLFVQDWGSLIGLRVAGLNPDWFASIGVGNGALPIYPAGEEVFPPVENPNEIIDLAPFYAQIPDQQVPFYDGCERLFTGQDNSYFGNWMEFAMKSSQFVPSGTVEAQTWFPVPEEVEAAYDAPFPSRIYMAGIRKFPSLVNEVPGTTLEAWGGLSTFEKPFITIWAANDAGQMGGCEAAEVFINTVPGAADQPHARIPEASHFLQDDQGEEIASRLVEFYRANGIEGKEEQVGYEIHQIVSMNEIITWKSTGMTQAEFDAIELPAGWFKNQPREGLADGGSFARSPDATADGSLTVASHFGHEWEHVATIIEANIALDEQGLFSGNLIAKYHTIRFNAGSVLSILVSPEGDQYVLVSRDHGRSSDTFEVPDGWQLVDYTTPEELIIPLPNPTMNIRTQNEDSYQGPIPPLELGL